MKTSLRNLKQKRDNRQSVFLVTGGTGFLGSHIAVALLKKGFKVIMLCRPGKGISARGRVEQLFDWFRLKGGSEINRPEVIEGTIDQPRLGLTNEEYVRLSSSFSEIVHCAANTSFSDLKREELERANVGSLENLFELAVRTGSHCCYFHHISTAYTAGKRVGHCEETLPETNEFHNAYEETKYRGEKYIWETFPSEGIHVNIYRPSIVYGDSLTGRTFRFNALYYPLKVFVFLKNTFTKDIEERGGEKSREMGVSMGADGAIYLPIRLESVPDGVIDLIPIDFFIDAFMAILDESLEGGIFHIVGGAPKKLGEIIDFIEKYFHIKGLTPVRKEDFEKVAPNALETLFNSYLDLYGPYIRDRRRFNNDKAAAILEKRNIKCPDFDYDIFARCMDYATAVDWGKKLNL